MSGSDDLSIRRPVTDTMTITAALDDLEIDVDVPRVDLGRARADAVMAAVSVRIPGVDRVPLVVERTGIPAWGAAAGGDLLRGDRLVVAEQGRLPLVVGTAGPAAGAVVTVGDGIGFDAEGAPTSGPGAVAVIPSIGGIDLTVDGPASVTVDGAVPAGRTKLRAGDVIQVGPSTFVLVADVPPRRGQLTELGSIFVTVEPAPADLAVDPEQLPLGRIVGTAAGRGALLWSVTSDHPAHLALPVGPSASVAPLPGRPFVVAGPPATAIGFVAACVLRWAVLHGPDEIAIRFAAEPGSPLDDLAHRFRFLPHRQEDHPDHTVVEVATLDAVAADDPSPPRLLLVPTPADAPTGSVAVVDVTDGVVEHLPLPVIDPLTRLLSPLVPLPPVR